MPMKMLLGVRSIVRLVTRFPNARPLSHPILCARHWSPELYVSSSVIWKMRADWRKSRTSKASEPKVLLIRVSIIVRLDSDSTDSFDFSLIRRFICGNNSVGLFPVSAHNSQIAINLYINLNFRNPMQFDRNVSPTPLNPNRIRDRKPQP